MACDSLGGQRERERDLMHLVKPPVYRSEDPLVKNRSVGKPLIPNWEADLVFDTASSLASVIGIFFSLISSDAAANSNMISELRVHQGAKPSNKTYSLEATKEEAVLSESWTRAFFWSAKLTICDEEEEEGGDFGSSSKPSSKSSKSRSSSPLSSADVARAVILRWVRAQRRRRRRNRMWREGAMGAASRAMEVKI